MNSEEVLRRIKDAGIVGAGGAGFPAHVKLNCKADVVIANGTECEPLLRTDRVFMERYPERVVQGIKIAMLASGAKRGVIALKRKYAKAVEALRPVAAGAGVELLLMDSFYPAGDEQQIVYEVAGRAVPTGGLPIDVGAVVQNVATLGNIAAAVKEGTPVTEKYVTVNGEVAAPAVFKVPIGMPASAVVRAAGGPEDLSGYRVIVGGPMMGRLADDVNEPVTKTTGGLIVLREDHPLVIKKSGRMQTDLKLARSVCCQCSFCTQLCPRNALGLKVEPHKVMRALALGAPDMGDANGIFSCCDCGICTFYACNFGLAPSRMMQRAKQELLKSGVRPQKKTARDASGNKDDIRVPVKRLISRLGIEKYDRDLPLNDELLETGKVRIPLKMHVGSPAKPVVSEGERVEKGLRIAAVSEGIGADVHASISGRVHITESCIEIEG